MLIQSTSTRFIFQNQNDLKLIKTKDIQICLVQAIEDNYDRQDYIQNQIIQMFHPEDRRKGTTINIKSALGSNSQNNLITALEKKRQDISKEKNRYQNVQCRVKTTHSPENLQQFDPRGSAIINFRNIKNNQNTHKINKECVPMKVNPKTTISEASKGIQINLNIQNIPSNHKSNLNEALSDRSLSHKKREQQKSTKLMKKISKTIAINNVDDFGCNQELEIRIERKTQKKFISPSYLQKNKSEKSLAPLIKFKTVDIIDDLQRQIRQFEIQAEKINTQAQMESVSYLDARHICYEIDPQYIQKQQKNLNWSMRAILMDWMMHISYEFRLKRQTLHIALAIVDNYFEVAPNLAKADFQLTGATSLFIAAKLQQFQPLSSKQFAKSTKQRYSAQQIKTMELNMCRSLKYNLNPPTINMWANKIMQQWDLFLEGTTILKQPFFQNHQPLYFKKIDEECYKNYRQMMQILDCTILDIQTVQYKPKVLVCSLLYLVLGKQFNEFNKKKILGQFARTSLFFLEESAYNSMFRYFLESRFGLQMYELLPSVQYLSTYFSLPLSFDRPCLHLEQQKVQNMHLEEYCSYQTYNPNMLAIVRKRYRGIYQ